MNYPEAIQQYLPKNRSKPMAQNQDRHAYTPSRLETAPQQSQSQAPVQAPVRRQLSQAAAEAAQRWEELENDYAHTKQSLMTAQAQLEVQDKTIATMKASMESLVHENERLVRENSSIDAKIETAAKILLDLRRPAVEVEAHAITDAIQAQVHDQVRQENKQ